MTARIPELRFLGWFLWTMVGADDDAALDKAGTYLIARFPDDCPSVVDIVDERIFYVGETHGRTRTLRARLTEFGRSAGFGGDQERGHYAAWGYPDAFPEDRGSRRRTDSSKVYVALCPFPGGDLPIAARGVFPGLVESLVLWQYANAHRRLPRSTTAARTRSGLFQTSPRSMPTCWRDSSPLRQTETAPPGSCVRSWRLRSATHRTARFPPGPTTDGAV